MSVCLKNWNEKAISGLLRTFDLVKVVGCTGDPLAGVLHITFMVRPRSLQLAKPEQVGQPLPLVDSGTVTQRRERGKATVSSNEKER